jgi:hypothetical protein
MAEQQDAKIKQLIEGLQKTIRTVGNSSKEQVQINRELLKVIALLESGLARNEEDAKALIAPYGWRYSRLCQRRTHLGPCLVCRQAPANTNGYRDADQADGAHYPPAPVRPPLSLQQTKLQQKPGAQQIKNIIKNFRNTSEN